MTRTNRTAQWKSILITNLTTLIGTIATAYLLFASSNQTTRSQSQNAFNTNLLTRVQQQDAKIEKLETETSKLKAQLMESNLKNIELMSKLSKEVNANAILFNYLDSNPLPAWIKDSNLKMYAINRAYEQTYCKYRNAYIGKTDYDVWPENIAKQFIENDKIVQKSQGYVMFKEKIDNYDCISGELLGKVQLTIWKFAVQLPDGTRGVGGITVAEKDIK